ncbi:hypothetical protein B8X04_09230 [Brevibacterium casei]|uniref:Uncharacterized protein n=1 Tax=Brevibacterium casei TaxID=33889 RepID=A0A269ZD65_9MICO|nr:hypothetical protein [Brevibacterium casei]PAK95450.1 hypothetical protein B8X04_09230 [Brevibacterium casei]
MVDDFGEEERGSGLEGGELSTIAARVDVEDVGERGIGVDLEARRRVRLIGRLLVGSTRAGSCGVREVCHCRSPAFSTTVWIVALSLDLRGKRVNRKFETCSNEYSLEFMLVSKFGSVSTTPWTTLVLLSAAA